MRFYTIKEAAAAIADELHGADYAGGEEGPRAFAERSYVAALRDAVGKNRIVYREPASKLPITQPSGIGAYMTSNWCIVSAADLNAWLDTLGTGVQLPAEPDEGEAPSPEAAVPGLPSDEWPKSAELANVLGPFVKHADRGEWLRKRLGDLRRDDPLRKYRRLEDGKRVARWNVAAVALYLVEKRELSREDARAALEKHYPKSAQLLGEIGLTERAVQSTWHPNGD
ncbi:hypothetical protein [Burkholderia gladioli]|uniref:hypothetical protein n=1 Tax=Burkholderia gladioli TaxID=28095 RepID=UPI00164206B3|nr:hypothetical protein [Burkholderia gladioli]MBJ9674503.1 hypothetical protein [Burkholderia gladioli]MDN7462627.1 hypothetical protein [Burkholderia gladioli]